MRRWMPFLVLALVAVPAFALVQDEPIAIVAKVTGAVTVQSGATDPVALGVGTRLMPGDRIVPAEGAEATLLRIGGQRMVVNEPVEIASREAVERGDMFTRTVGVLAQAATTEARNVPNRQGMIRPIPGEPTPIRPRNGIATLELAPTLVWAAVDGASEYTVQIRRVGAAPVRYTATDTTFAVPDALEPGHTYYWTVAAGRRAAREDSLVVASAETRGSIETSIASIRELGFDPQDDGRVLALTIYADLGLYYEALAEIEAIEATGAPLGFDLLLLKGEVLDALGRVDEARAAFDAADALMGG